MDGLLDTNALMQYAAAQGLLNGAPPVAASPNVGDASSFDDRFNAAPASFATRFNAAPQLSGNIPLPQPRPASANDDSEAIPANATLTQGVGNPLPDTSTQTPSPVPETSLLGRLGAAFANFGAGGRRGGLIGALSGAAQGATTGLQIDPLGAANQTMLALKNRGVPSDLAAAAATNPTIMQQLLPMALGVKQMQFTQIGEDMLGNKKYGFVDPVRGTITPFEGSTPFGGGAGSSAIGTGNINPNLAGDDYLKQFPQEVQAAVKAYIGGESMPTGNPRAGFTQAVKMVAQKYGNDIGLPADDTTFTARRQMRNQLSNAAPSSLGGQINTGNTAIGHLADLSQKALDLGNVSSMGPDVSHWINWAREHASTDQSAKVQALIGAAQHYGQEITKFYAGSPGGEAERDRFISSINGARTPQELASVIETEAELMRSRLGSIGTQISGTLGPLANQYPVVRPESDKAFGTISDNVSRLRGNKPAASAAPQAQPAAPAANIPRIMTPAQRDMLKPGQPYYAPDGSLRVKQ